MLVPVEKGDGDGFELEGLDVGGLIVLGDMERSND